MEIVVLPDRIANKDLEVLIIIRNFTDHNFEVLESFNYFILCQIVEAFFEIKTIE